MIETERLQIIPLQINHLEWLRKMRNSKNTWFWLTNVLPINEIQQQQWFEKLCIDPTKMYFAIEHKESYQPIGIIRSDEWDKVNRSIRIGIDIDEYYRQKGYAYEAFKAFIDYLFKHLNLHRIWLITAEYNLTGQKLYQKLGFKEEGKQRDALYRNSKYNDYICLYLTEDMWLENII